MANHCTLVYCIFCMNSLFSDGVSVQYVMVWFTEMLANRGTVLLNYIHVETTVTRRWWERKNQQVQCRLVDLDCLCIYLKGTAV